MTNILLSPIGRSPGAVTGIYYALAAQTEPVIIDKVVLIATGLNQVQRSAEIVQDTLGRDKVHILELHKGGMSAPTPFMHDFSDEATVIKFIQHVNSVLSHAHRGDNKIYIGISGGRSSMGALATLSAYVYGAAGLYHLCVSKEIEDKGDVDNLPGLASQRRKILEPPVEDYRLISIPLAPFDQLWDRGRLGTVLLTRPEAREALLRTYTDFELQQLDALRRQNSVSLEEMGKSLKKIFKDTNLERAMDAAVQIYCLNPQKATTSQELIQMAMGLQNCFPPSIWQQILTDLGNWNSWKSGAGWSVDQVKWFIDELLTTAVALANSKGAVALVTILGLKIP